MKLSKDTLIEGKVVKKGVEVQVVRESWGGDLYNAIDMYFKKTLQEEHPKASIGSTLGSVISGSLGSLRMNEYLSKEEAYEILTFLEKEIEAQMPSFTR